MTTRTVLVLGAPGSGRSWLVKALADALPARGPACDWAIAECAEPAALQDPQAIALLMGLDLPGLGPEHNREDQRLRQALVITQTPFRVIYGQGLARLNNALLALGLPGQTDDAGSDRARAQFRINRGRDQWQCNACSDPGCEHQLFTGLLAQRAD